MITSSLECDGETDETQHSQAYGAHDFDTGQVPTGRGTQTKTRQVDL